MKAKSNSVRPCKGVSIITSTNRPDCMGNIFKNYRSQRYPKKELVIIVNNEQIDLAPYLKMAQKLKDVQVYRLARSNSLGACLNYAVSKTNYSYIAKFDDDDYYAPLYLTTMVRALQRKKADIVGKRAHFMYLQGARKLILRFGGEANRSVSILPGATLVIKRTVFRKVRFRHVSVGEDDYFCTDCIKKGFKVFSAGKYHFVAIRRKNSQNHTWVIDERLLLNSSVHFPRIRNYKKFVNRGSR